MAVGPDDGNAPCRESPLAALESEITPTDRFFVRSHFPVPAVDAVRWRVVVDGEVRQRLSLTLGQLKRMPHHDVVATVECAGNSRSSMSPRAEGVLWGHGAVGTARWRGVPLAFILERAGLNPGVHEVVLRGADRGKEPGANGVIDYEMSVPIEKATDPDTLVVDSMNGRPLELRHGFPLRVVVPGWYGMASVKWLTRVTAVASPFKGYFRGRAYTYIHEGEAFEGPRAPATTARVKALITWPGERHVLSQGRHRVRGVAWSGDAAIARVEVSGSPNSDDRLSWRPARLRPSLSPYAWRHWEVELDLLRPGFYTLRARATDARGRRQPMRADWNYRGIGNNSVHCVPVEVRRTRPKDAEA
ncbi:MAG TPA: sulfite oxidase [Thermoplasmata archaeon]|nr:sulfite oxidase [Thermoplasmata archaeon]